MKKHAEQLQSLIEFFENLSEESTKNVAHHYATNARFVDPFNDVDGIQKIEHIFAHMFKTTQRPRFVVLSALLNDDEAFLRWDFTFEKKGLPKNMCIHGATRLVFDASGKVTLHRDYWDSGAELYAKLPIVGGFFRWFAKQFRA